MKKTLVQIVALCILVTGYFLVLNWYEQTKQPEPEEPTSLQYIRKDYTAFGDDSVFTILIDTTVYFYNGKMHRLQIFNRALTPKEINFINDSTMYKKLKISNQQHHESRNSITN